MGRAVWRSNPSTPQRAGEQTGPMARLGRFSLLRLAAALHVLACLARASSDLEPIVEFDGPGGPCGPGTMEPHIHDHGMHDCPLPGGWAPCSTGGFGELCVPPGVHVELFVFAHAADAELCETSASICTEMVRGSGHWYCDVRNYCTRFSNYDLVFTFLNDTDTLCYQPQVLDVCNGECGLGTFGWSGCGTPAIGMLGYILLIILGAVLCGTAAACYHFLRKLTGMLPSAARSGASDTDPHE
eukprot:NODE_2361_length_950_cov_306.528492.p1 GENE.NODE_2361_length_950_cov_306.528492~~NODE_2361_length_950_cov_306.528492.p1  ORF type:complete len:242 (+),score=60.77 NODE_2361_length_950_cov_306.528492:3-728(+)